MMHTIFVYVPSKSSSGLNDQWALVKGLPLQAMISSEQNKISHILSKNTVFFF